MIVSEVIQQLYQIGFGLLRWKFFLLTRSPIPINTAYLLIFYITLVTLLSWLIKGSFWSSIFIIWLVTYRPISTNSIFPPNSLPTIISRAVSD